MMRMTVGAMIAGAFLTFASAGAQAQSGSATIDAIVKRGEVNCGLSGNAPMFSLPDSQGVMRGLDADFCRSVAASILGDVRKVKFIPTTAQNRFTALQSGEVDMLARNTTWTLSRDTSLGFDFPAISFFDGQGFMVKASLGVRTARELDGASICVQPGTTTEQNLTEPRHRRPGPAEPPRPADRAARSTAPTRCAGAASAGAGGGRRSAHAPAAGG